MAEDDLEDELEEDVEDDDLDDEEGDSGGSSSGGKKKLLIIVGAVLLLLIGGGAAAYFTGLLDPLLGGSEKTVSGSEPVADGEALFFDLDEMVVNLNTSGRRQSVLKIKVALELASQADLVKVQAVVPRVIDNFQTYLRELRVDDLNGSAGLYRLREELLTRVNVAVQPAKVNAILFKEMLIQ